MSDRAAFNTTLNREFDELLSKVIPDVVANWETLREDEKQSLMNVSHYFCGLHLTVNFAEAVKALKSVEGAMLEGKNPFTFDNSECGTFRLLRTACKAFEEHGSDEAGVASQFNAFLKGKGEDVHLVSWRGNNQHRLLQCHSTLLSQKSPRGVPGEVAECQQVAEVC